MSNTFIASTSQVLWRTLESYGMDPEALFREAGLDPARWNEPDGRFDADRLDLAWRRALQLTGDPCLGLRAARFVNPASLHALGFAWLASDTLFDALSRLVRYARLLSDGLHLELSVSGGECRLSVAQAPGPPILAQRMDAFWAGVLGMCRMSLSDEFAPISLALRHPQPGCAADYYALFRAPIQFAAPCDMMTIARELAERPLPTANRTLAAANDQVVSDYLARLNATSLPDRVRNRLIESLPGGPVSEQDVAQALALSRRTLQRRLAEEGTSFKVLLDEARRELALRFIGEQHFSIKETTYLLGFSEPGNFARAFKRWTGDVPSRYRQRRIAATAP